MDGEIWVLGVDPGDSKLLGVGEGVQVLKKFVKLNISSKIEQFSVSDKHAAAVDGRVEVKKTEGDCSCGEGVWPEN